MKLYTDYPFLISDQQYGYASAPVREVEYISYDGNKYVTIQFENKLYDIKYGYLFSRPELIGTDKHFVRELFDNNFLLLNKES